jgi:NADP-dependent 3-hydroxy acid dehydrogenase YdfG
MKIDGSVCIVTGASSGIGAATSRLLSASGARVVLAARRIDRLEALAAELPGALAVQTDVTAPGELQQLVDEVVQTFGRVDVLVNDAGQGLHVPIEEIDPADLRAVFELNVIAPLVAMQLVLPHMRARGAGAIVNVSSATSLRLFPGIGGYAATKAALNVITQVAHLELAPSGIALSVVYPSVTATEFHDHLRAGHLAQAAMGMTPDPPELVAQAIAFAISTGEEHVLVADPPRGFAPGDSEGWGSLLARQSPAGPPAADDPA